MHHVAEHNVTDPNGLDFGPGHGLLHHGRGQLGRSLTLECAAVVTDRCADTAQYDNLSRVAHRVTTFLYSSPTCCPKATSLLHLTVTTGRSDDQGPKSLRWQMNPTIEWGS